MGVNISPLLVLPVLTKVLQSLHRIQGAHVQQFRFRYRSQNSQFSAETKSQTLGLFLAGYHSFSAVPTQGSNLVRNV